MYQFAIGAWNAHQFDGTERFDIKFYGIGRASAEQFRCQRAHAFGNGLDSSFRHD